MAEKNTGDNTGKLFNRRFVVRALLYAAAALGLLGCDRLLGLTGDEDEAGPRHSEERPAEETGETEPKSAAEPVKPEADQEEPAADPEDPEEPLDGNLVPKRILGRTGARVSIIGLGGSFLVSQAERAEEAEMLIEEAVEAGINYIDTAPTYASSEVNIGRVMPRLRNRVFLATKTIERTYDGTMKLLEQSLERLQTDHIDLLQLHGFHAQGDYDRAFSRGGAFEALEKLKAEGVVRFTGITSHKNPGIVKEAIKHYDFDCILLALNPADRHDRSQSFLQEVLPLANARKMGPIAMKVASYGRLFRSGGIESMQQSLGYVLSFPVSTAIIGFSNRPELEECVEIARKFKPLPGSALEELETLVKPYHAEAAFFKTQW